MKNRLIFSSLVLVFSLFVITDVRACSVGPDWTSDPKIHFESSGIVFVGTVKDFEHKGDINGTFIITFDVEDSYKGNIGNTIEISTGANSAMCGYDTPFVVGDVWSIYASKDLYTSSITANKKYEKVENALSELDGLFNNTVACPLNYDPVCGRKDTGIRCITTPCDSTEDITYGNSCALEADKAEFLYEGVCEVVIDSPNNCKQWFDGCNQCVRSVEGGPLACTEMACMEKDTPTCNEYFVDSTVDEPVFDETPEFEYPDTSIPETKGFWNQFIDFITKILTFNF